MSVFLPATVAVVAGAVVVVVVVAAQIIGISMCLELSQWLTARFIRVKQVLDHCVCVTTAIC